MIIRSLEPEFKVVVERDPVKTSFEKWAKPGHFSKTLAKALIVPLGSGIYMLMLTILIVILMIWKIFLAKYLTLIFVN
jgi:hypothetical protein